MLLRLNERQERRLPTMQTTPSYSRSTGALSCNWWVDTMKEYLCWIRQSISIPTLLLPGRCEAFAKQAGADLMKPYGTSNMPCGSILVIHDDGLHNMDWPFR